MTRRAELRGRRRESLFFYAGFWATGSPRHGGEGCEAGCVASLLASSQPAQKSTIGLAPLPCDWGPTAWNLENRSSPESARSVSNGLAIEQGFFTQVGRRATSWSRCRPSSWKSTTGWAMRLCASSPARFLERATSSVPEPQASAPHQRGFFCLRRAAVCRPGLYLRSPRLRPCLTARGSAKHGSPWTYSNKPLMRSTTSWRWPRPAASRMPSSA